LLLAIPRQLLTLFFLPVSFSRAIRRWSLSTYLSVPLLKKSYLSLLLLLKVKLLLLLLKAPLLKKVSKN
jgi:hypothetical protein